MLNADPVQSVMTSSLPVRPAWPLSLSKRNRSDCPQDNPEHTGGMFTCYGIEGPCGAGASIRVFDFAQPC